jgi:DNA-directed RNA polymerase specialized sigma24 family protein
MKQRKAGFDVIGQLAALRRYAWVLARDRSKAEDLVHDALVRAYEGRRTFRAGGDLRGWLFSILHNTFISGLRRCHAERAPNAWPKRSTLTSPRHMGSRSGFSVIGHLSGARALTRNHAGRST